MDRCVDDRCNADDFACDKGEDDDDDDDDLPLLVADVAVAAAEAAVAAATTARSCRSNSAMAACDSGPWFMCNFT